ncbi:WSC domain-containing protein [Triangularia setosa]|uniref:WSC domain-containing protein n=1 Tax=Triangularia setosa TaxID=2587417 RepID=A0AAN7ABN3_9PEZI|nr:WSC domain-containing protein [Podospora setosa]
MASIRFTSLVSAVLAFTPLAVRSHALPLQSKVTNLGEYKYQGCYTDSRDDRTLTGKAHYDESMSLKKCAAACTDYQWFGATFGSQCFCGTSLLNAAEKRPESECGMNCGGSKCQKCGDANRINVYWTGKETTATEPPLVGTFEYQSCWTDDKNARSLRGGKHQRSDLTVEVCAEICKDFRYFGLESSSECLCGNELGGEAAPEEQCSQLCPGNPEQWCGGSERINVYANTALPLFTTTTEAATTQSTTVTQPLEEESTTASEPQYTTVTLPSEDILDTTTTTEPEFTTVTLAPDESTPTPTSFTMTEGMITPTPAPTPTTTTICELTQSLLPVPATCWAAVPTGCSQMTRVQYPAVTQVASQCLGAFVVAATTPPAIADCFTDIKNRNFVGSSAYSCVASASVYCQATSVCVSSANPSAPASQPTNILGDYGGFENGVLWTPSTASGNAISVEVSSEIVRSGNFALKAVFDNSNGSSRNYVKTVSLLPGRTYEASWWWWSEKAGTHTVSRMMFNGGGTTFVKDAGTQAGPAGQWVKATHQFTAGASVGSVIFSVYGNKGADSNTFYVDDISIITVD